jgi:hypothetical protein
MAISTLGCSAPSLQGATVIDALQSTLAATIQLLLLLLPLTPWLRHTTIPLQSPLLLLSFLPLSAALNTAAISPFAVPAPAIAACPAPTCTSPSVSVQLHTTISAAAGPAIAAILQRPALLPQIWPAASVKIRIGTPGTVPLLSAPLQLLLVI